MKMVEIIWRKRTDDFHACINGEPGYWGCGKTLHAAIGNLILTHPGRFSIVIVHREENGIVISHPGE
jgi:hypothetical protein